MILVDDLAALRDLGLDFPAEDALRCDCLPHPAAGRVCGQPGKWLASCSECQATWVFCIPHFENARVRPWVKRVCGKCWAKDSAGILIRWAPDRRAEVSAAVDVDTSQLEALEFEVPCDVADVHVQPLLGPLVITAIVQCRRPAEWSATCRSCGLQSMVCDQHRHAHLADTPVCPRCHNEGEDNFLYEPLPKGGR